MAAKRTYMTEGVQLRRTIGGWAGTIGNATFIFRKVGNLWVPRSHQHRAKPLSEFTTLADVVRWAQAHVKTCLISCDETYNPFQGLKAPTTSPRVGVCHNEFQR